MHKIINIKEMKRLIKPGILAAILLLCIFLPSTSAFSSVQTFWGNAGCSGSYGTGDYAKDQLGNNLAVGSVVQYIFAGPNNTIDDPAANGMPGGDDRLLKTAYIGNDTVYTVFSGEPGLFYNTYSGANCTYETTSGANPYVYIRTWNSSNLYTATYYGNTPRFVPGIPPAFPDEPIATFSTNVSFIPVPPTGTPVITGFTPPAGTDGITMTITGTDFGTSTGTVRFDISGASTVDAVAYTTWTDNQIVVTVPTMSAGKYRVLVRSTVPLTGVSGSTYYHKVPYLASISPLQGDLSTLITLTGSNFASATNVNVDSALFLDKAITPISDTSIQFTLPPTTPTGANNISVDNPFGTSNQLTFTVTTSAGTPTFSSIAPVSGTQGMTIVATIDGTNTHFQSLGTPVIAISGTGVTATLVGAPLSETRLTCIITVGATAALGARNVTVTTGSEIITGTGVFTVLVADTTAPTVGSVSPIDGATGESVTPTITITFIEDGSGVNPATFVAPSSFTIYGEAGKSGPGLTPANVRITGNVGSFEIVGVLSTNEVITVIINNNAIRDNANNPMTYTPAYQWSFRTTLESTTPPDNRLFESQGGIMMAYPNPFNPLDKAHPLRMLFGATTGEAIDIYIFDATARIIWQHKDRQLTANREVLWDGETSYGDIVSNGIYLVRIVKDDKIVARAKILVKKK